VRLAAIFLLCACATAAWARTVAIDVGHDTGEPGVISAYGRPELEFNRELALDIRAAVEGRGLTTRLIGADGSMAKLAARTAAAAGADFFLSVHHDSMQPQFLQTWEHEGALRRFSESQSGFSLFVSRKNAASGRSLACASAIGAEMRAVGFAPSLYHADPIRGESKAFADRANGVHYYDNLVVLKTARMPAALLEAGVIVNRDEEQRMRMPETRQRISAAVAQGLARCLPRSDKRGSPAK
jgi:N-acetylmuramoyl-L-alanine amidase